MAKKKISLNNTHYKRKLNTVPDINHVKHAYKKSNTLKLLLYKFLIFINFALIYYLYFVKFPETQQLYIIYMPIILFLIFLLLSLLSLSHYLFDSALTDNKTFEKINKIFKEVCKPIIEKKEEKPNLFIIENKEPIAVTTNSLFLNFSKRLNGIFISNIYFEFLNQKELLSLFAHKIAHFRYYLDIFQREFFNKNLFYSLFIVSLIQIMGTKDIIEKIEGIVFIATLIFTLIIKILKKNKDKSDYLSDFYAAKKYGKLEFINMLLIEGRIREMYLHTKELVCYEIMKTKDIDSIEDTSISEEIFKSMYGKKITKTSIKKRIKEFFASSEINKYKSILSKEDIKIRNEAIFKSFKKYFKRKHIDWNLFEVEKKDFKISKQEYPYLIKAILDNPRKKLFPFNFKKLYARQYNSIEDRILFIHKNIDDG